MDFASKIHRTNEKSKKDCQHIGEIITIKDKKDKDINIYKMVAIKKKHLVGCIMKCLGETTQYDIYKNTELGKTVIEAVENTVVDVGEIITHIQTRDYSNNRPNSPSTCVSYEHAKKDLQTAYNVVKDRITWMEFLLQLDEVDNVIILDDEIINSLPDCNMKTYLNEVKELNKVYEGRLNELCQALPHVKTKGLLIKSSSIPESIDSKKNKQIGASNSRIGTQRAVMYNIEFGFKAYVELPKELEDKLHNEVTFCANESVCEIVKHYAGDEGVNINELFLYTRKNKSTGVKLSEGELV